jgi:glycine/D-amino acid oxidase-like deaminating enzyme
MCVLICGGGVIGAAIAYFLSRRGARPVVIERAGIAAAASGKSGGFLALDWCDGTPLAALARRSFALHTALPGEVGADWGFRRLDTYAGRLAAADSVGRSRNALGWLGSEMRIDGRIGTPETTAQVVPGAFTAALMRAAAERGAQLKEGVVTGLLGADAGRVMGVLVDGVPIEGDAVVIAMGPWSTVAARLLPLPPIFGLKGHSLVFATGDAVPPEALFLEAEEADGSMATPEVFPRPDGTTYVCAISSQPPLPADPAGVAPDPGAIERLAALCARISPVLAAAPVLARQACFRPIAADGLPLIGAVADIEDAYVATGHSVWGILNAPATGEAMAELILDGAAHTVDLKPFDPRRLPPPDD